MSQPSKSDWAAIYQAAMEFQQASAWEWMDSEDLFAVEDPSSGQMGYCSVLGSGQEEFGLGVFLGDAGYHGYLNMVLGEAEPANLDEGVKLPLLTVLFSDRGDLEKKDLDVIRSLGLHFRGKGAWPLFRSQLPGYLPWFLEKDEVLFLANVIHQTLIVANRVSKDELDLFAEDKDGLVLTRYYREGNWMEEWRKPPEPKDDLPEQTEPIGAVNEAQLHLLHSSAKKLSGTWELDIFMLPIPIGTPSDRPYFPTCFLAVERNQGLIMGTEMTGPFSTPRQKQDEIIKILEKVGQLPKEIRVKADKMRPIVEPITAILGINLRVGPLPVLEAAKAGLFQHLPG